MKLRLMRINGSIEDVDLPIEFNLAGNGRTCSPNNPWPVVAIGRDRYQADGTLVQGVLPGKWQIVGESKKPDQRLLVQEVAR